MPYVPVPKDLTKVKTKLAFNLTKRQLICFSLAALVGLPVYFLTRGAIGNSAAVLLMIGLMMPFFFFAMYEKNGQPPEKLLKNYIRVRFLTQQARPYRTQNRFAALERQAYFDEEVKQLVSNTEKTGAAQGRGLERRAGNPARHKVDRRTKKATGKGH